MDEQELRVKIYQRLGLEVGSLASESGNDWVRAKNEILEDYRKQEFEKLQKVKSINYEIITKDAPEFQLILNSKSFHAQYFKTLITRRSDLTTEEVYILFKTGDRDVLANLAYYQILDSNMIDRLISTGTYACKKNLLEKQSLSETQQKSLLQHMDKHKDIYQQLL